MQLYQNNFYTLLTEEKDYFIRFFSSFSQNNRQNAQNNNISLTTL